MPKLIAIWNSCACSAMGLLALILHAVATKHIRGASSDERQRSY